MRTKLHRKERGVWIAIGTAVFYIKDSGVWREITKAEMDVFGIQTDKADNKVPSDILNISIDLPKPEVGEDGDYYALLYPLAQDGEMWDGEVWVAEEKQEG